MVMIGIVILSFIGIILFIVFITSIGGESGSDFTFVMFLLSAIFGVFVWMIIENATYTESDPIPISEERISIMFDNDVVIVRVGEVFQHTYKTKVQYDNITSGNYSILEIIEYDITDEENGRRYELKINQ